MNLNFMTCPLEEIIVYNLASISSSLLQGIGIPTALLQPSQWLMDDPYDPKNCLTARLTSLPMNAAILPIVGGKLAVQFPLSDEVRTFKLLFPKGMRFQPFRARGSS